MEKRNVLLKKLIAIFAIFGIVSAIETAWATPEGSQNLRGLGGRVFFVEVQDLFAGTTFPNCYTFYSDGVWEDPPFPVLGTWSQDTNGAATTYSAGAVAEGLNIGTDDEPFLVTLVLEQRGSVTPARGRGNLQLWAFSQAIIVELGDLVVGEFISIGYEVDECPL